MPEPNKLRNMAKAMNTSERALIIGAIETTPSLRKAAIKLGISESGVRAACRRLHIRITRAVVSPEAVQP